MSSYIDSRDIVKEYDDMVIEREGYLEDVVMAEEILNDVDPEDEDATADAEMWLESARTNLEIWEQDNLDRFSMLESVIETGRSYNTGFDNGVTLIPLDKTEEYAKRTACDTCDMYRKLTWPLNCIDWTSAVDELFEDWTEIEFDGDTYYMERN